MTEENQQPTEEIKPTLEDILRTINQLAAKRDELTATISGMKKAAQRMIGAL